MKKTTRNISLLLSSNRLHCNSNSLINCSHNRWASKKWLFSSRTSSTSSWYKQINQMGKHQRFQVNYHQLGSSNKSCNLKTKTSWTLLSKACRQRHTFRSYPQCPIRTHMLWTRMLHSFSNRSKTSSQITCTTIDRRLFNNNSRRLLDISNKILPTFLLHNSNRRPI